MDHVQSIEELTKEIDRLKSLLQTKEDELSLVTNNRVKKPKKKKLLFRKNSKVKTNSKCSRVVIVSKDMNSTITNEFPNNARMFEKVIKHFMPHKKESKIQITDTTPRNYNYDANIDEVIKNFSDSLKVQEERIQAELNLKPKKKQKVSKVSARVTLSPKLLMNKIKKNFNKTKISVMKQAVNVSHKYGEYKEEKAYNRQQQEADRLQAKVEEERLRQRKADFKAAIKDSKKEEKLHLKEERKVKVNKSRAHVVELPSILMNSVKNNFNKVKNAIINKISNISASFKEHRENKDELLNQNTEEQNNNPKKGIKSKYGALYDELMEHKAEKQNQKKEKKEEKERRHKAILDMIKALDEEQKQVLRAQKEEISDLQAQIRYNINETGGRRR